MKKHIVGLIIAIELCIVIAASLIFFNWKEGKLSVSENRELAHAPQLVDASGKISETFFQDLKVWFEDNLGFREAYFTLSGTINYNLFNKSNANVEIGKDGWLYYDNENNLEIAKGGYPNFDESFLKQYCEDQIAIHEKLKAQNIEYVLVLPPSKVSIYPEFIASGDYKVSESPADIFADYIEANSDIKVVRLKESLLAEKERSEDNLFFKTDSHWSYAGRFVGYKKIIADLNKWGVISGDKLDAKLTDSGQVIGDLSKMMGPVKLSGEKISEEVRNWEIINPKAKELKKSDKLYSDVVELANRKHVEGRLCKVFENENANKRALIFGDSMLGQCLLEALAENFSNETFIWDYKIDQDMIDLIKPDVVILDISERNLTDALEEINSSALLRE